MAVYYLLAHLSIFAEVADPSAEITFKVDLGAKFVFPHPPNSGTKPVFERDGVRYFLRKIR